MRVIPEQAVVMPVGVAERAVGDLRERYDPWHIPASILLATWVPDDLAEVAARFSPFGFKLATAATRDGNLVLVPDPIEPFRDLVEALESQVEPELFVATHDNPATLDTTRMILKSVLPIEAYAAELSVYEGTTLVRTVPL